MFENKISASIYGCARAVHEIHAEVSMLLRERRIVNAETRRHGAADCRGNIRGVPCRSPVRF